MPFELFTITIAISAAITIPITIITTTTTPIPIPIVIAISISITITIGMIGTIQRNLNARYYLHVTLQAQESYVYSLVWPEKIQKKDISWLPREQTLSMRNHFEEEEAELVQVLLMRSKSEFICIPTWNEMLGGSRHAALYLLFA